MKQIKPLAFWLHFQASDKLSKVMLNDFSATLKGKWKKLIVLNQSKLDYTAFKVLLSPSVCRLTLEL